MGIATINDSAQPAAAAPGAIVTDGRVALSSTLAGDARLAVVLREVRHAGGTFASDCAELRALVHDEHAVPRMLAVQPPQRVSFLDTYCALRADQPHVVSIHYAAMFDGAAREARVCRQLLYPQQTIDVHEAATLEGGIRWLLRGALALLDEGASSTHVLALLRYLETRMHTLLLTAQPASRQPWATSTLFQRLRSALPGSETLWHFDAKQRKLVVLAQGYRLRQRIGTLLPQGWGGTQRPILVRHRGYKPAQIDALVHGLGADDTSVTREPIGVSLLPCLPRRCVEIVLGPTTADMERLRRLVHDPIWWKGAA